MGLQRGSLDIRYSSFFLHTNQQSFAQCNSFPLPLQLLLMCLGPICMQINCVTSGNCLNPKNISGFQPCCIMNMRLITFISLVLQPVRGHSAPLQPDFQSHQNRSGVALQRSHYRWSVRLHRSHAVPLVGLTLYCQR